MVCEELGKRIEKPIRILPRNATIVPATVRERGEMLVTEYPHKLPALLLEALRAKLTTTYLMERANDGHNAELRKLVDRGLEAVRLAEE